MTKFIDVEVKEQTINLLKKAAEKPFMIWLKTVAPKLAAHRRRQIIEYIGRMGAKRKLFVDYDDLEVDMWLNSSEYHRWSRGSVPLDKAEARDMARHLIETGISRGTIPSNGRFFCIELVNTSKGVRLVPYTAFELVMDAGVKDMISLMFQDGWFEFIMIHDRIEYTVSEKGTIFRNEMRITGDILEIFHDLSPNEINHIVMTSKFVSLNVR